MTISRPVRWLLVLALVLAAAVAFLLVRMYRGDIKALESFVASYERFDQASTELAVSFTDDADKQAGQALAELKERSLLRLSSLVRNDGLLMAQARTISDLAGQELEGLRSYRRAAEGPQGELDELALRWTRLSVMRKTVWARFRELARIGA